MTAADFFWVALIIGIPAIALPLPFAFLMQSFGREQWAARRALVTSVIFTAAGYLAALAYYLINGIPDSIRSNPEAAQTAAGQAVMGAFIAGGYGSFAAFIYFYWIRRSSRDDRRSAQP